MLPYLKTWIRYGWRMTEIQENIYMMFGYRVRIAKLLAWIMEDKYGLHSKRERERDTRDGHEGSNWVPGVWCFGSGGPLAGLQQIGEVE